MSFEHCGECKWYHNPTRWASTCKHPTCVHTGRTVEAGRSACECYADRAGEGRTLCDLCGHDVPLDESHDCPRCGAVLCGECICDCNDDDNEREG